MIIYGQEGVGKSTFASLAPAPIFIPTEDGLANIDCHSFPLQSRFDGVMDCLRAVAKTREYYTVVIDSLDWLEPLVWARTCADHGVSDIEKIGGGYGKGYVAAVDVWCRFVAALDFLRNNRGLHVILLAHAKAERFEDPEHPPFDRWAPRLHKHGCDRLKEWVDIIGFAHHKTTVRTTDAGFGRQRAVAVGRPVNMLRLRGGPACVAKSRGEWPDEMELDAAEFWKLFAENQKKVLKNEEKEIKDIGEQTTGQQAGEAASGADSREHP